VNIPENPFEGIRSAKPLVGGLRWTHREVVGSDTFTRLVCFSVIWENVTEHVAGPFNAWGSRGRRFKSCQPDNEEFLQVRGLRELFLIYDRRFVSVLVPLTSPVHSGRRLIVFAAHWRSEDDSADSLTW
jgi:hypothetical protein